MSIRRIYSLLFVILAFAPVEAQNLHLSHFSEANGMPSNQVRDVIKDAHGMFWIASDAGVVRFDGTEFTYYTKQIPSQYCRSFCRVPEGLLLSHDAGVSLIRPGLDTSEISLYLPGSIQPEKESLYYPDRFFLRQNGELWINQPGGRISKFINGSVSDVIVATEKKDPSGPGAFFAETTEGALWIAFSDGRLCLFNDESQETKQLLSLSMINDLQLRNNELWIAGEQIYRIILSEDGRSIAEKEMYTSGEGEVTALSPDSQGNIYLAIKDKGLYYLDQRPGRTHQFIKVFSNNNPHSVDELPFRNIHKIVMESDDRLWICSSEGLGILQRRFFESLGSVPNANTSSICIAENGRIFVDFGDVYVIDQTEVGYEGSLLQGFSRGTVTAITAANNRLWTGTSTGRLFQLDQAGRAMNGVDLRPRGEGIFFMNHDNQGRLWVCQAPEERPLTGIGCLLPDGTLKEYGPEKGLQSLVLCLRETEKGRIFCSGSGAETYLYRYLPGEDIFLNLSLPLDFNPGMIFAVHDLSVDNNGVIWLASTHGLLRYDMERVTRVELDHVNSEIEMRAVCAMDDGSVWVSTDTEGIIRYSDTSSIVIREESGLPSEVMSYRCLVKEKGGRLWVGSSEGVVYSLEENPKPRTSNKPFLVKAFVDGEPTIDRDFSLFRDQELSLEFVAPSFHGFKTFYQYRINETEWKDPSTNRTIIFREQEPGQYKLSVRSRKEGGYLWSEAEHAEIKIESYWYQEPYFWIITALLILGVTIIYVVARRKKYRQSISELARGLQAEKEEIEKRTADLEKAKDHILIEQRHVRAQRVSMEIMHRLITRVSPGMKWDVVLEILSIELMKFPGVVAFEIGSRKGKYIEFEGFSERAGTFTSARVEYNPDENISSYTIDISKPMIYNQLKNDVERLSLQPEKRLGYYKSAISVPFYLEKEPGVLTLYADKTDHFTKYGLQAMGVFATYLEQIF